MAEEVRAEMVANVLAVSVAEGEQVQPGQAMAILESMKMEIPVVPEVGGGRPPGGHRCGRRRPGGRPAVRPRADRSLSRSAQGRPIGRR